MSACEQGHLEVIQMIVKLGGVSLIEFKSKGGSPLHAAMSCGEIQEEEDSVLDQDPRPYAAVKLILKLYQEADRDVKKLTN